MKRVINYARQTRNKAIAYALQPTNRNDPRTRALKEGLLRAYMNSNKGQLIKTIVNYTTANSKNEVTLNMRNAIHAYVNKNSGNYQNGKKVGQKAANAFMKYINRGKAGKETPFRKGMTNGAIQSVVYYLPGVVVRGTLKKIRGNTRSNANNRTSSTAAHSAPTTSTTV
jgi:hypothetical protein